jgi:hypothetical protein
MDARFDMFAYLAAFVTIVLALAVSDMIQSLHRLLQARGRVRWSLVAILAAAAVFLAILEEFFALWRLAGIERFTYPELMILIAPPVILSLAALTALPDIVPAEGMELEAYYMDNRRTLYLLLGLWVLAVFVRLSGLFEIVEGRSGNWMDVLTVFPWQTIPLIGLLGLLAWSRNRWFQLGGLLAIILLVNAAMMNRSIELPPAS